MFKKKHLSCFIFLDLEYCLILITIEEGNEVKEEGEGEQEQEQEIKVCMVIVQILQPNL